ncbi:hypothetical protein [Maritalea sp.]|uniref:hypothetical protein n=1 Tax=Maritalea sp. TaxID=2003361 RepID=UPI003EF8A692
MTEFITISMRPIVVRRAIIIALIVGTIIAIINYYDKMMGASLSAGDVMKIGATFLVPYAVSTMSSVMAIKDNDCA